MKTNDDLDTLPNDNLDADATTFADKENIIEEETVIDKDIDIDNIEETEIIKKTDNIEEEAIEEAEASNDNDIDFNQSIGQILQQLREQRSLKIDKIADALRLDISTVENLEQGNYSVMPPTIFIQGYIRSYAKFLEIDPEPLVQHYYQQEGNAPDLQYAAPKNIHMSVEQRVLNSERSNSKKKNSGSISFILFIVLLIAAGIFWQQKYKDDNDFSLLPTESNNGTINVITDSGLIPPNLPGASNNLVAANNTGTDSYTPPTEGSDADQVVTVNNLENNTTATAETANEAANNTAINTTTITTEAVATTANASSTAATNTETSVITEVEIETVMIEDPKPSVDKLSISFKGASWTEVYDATGKRLYYKTSKTGTGSNFTGKPPFKIRMGKPEVTTITYLGEEINLKKYYGRVSTIKIGKTPS